MVPDQNSTIKYSTENAPAIAPSVIPMFLIPLLSKKPTVLMFHNSNNFVPVTLPYFGCVP